MTLHMPTIIEDDLRAFHSKHLAGCPLPTAFFFDYEEAVETSTQSYGDDDGLGWYEDGVKRTLTDEQIAMFRHSEIQALLTERRHRREGAEEGEDVEISTDLGANVRELPPTDVVAETVILKEEAEITEAYDNKIVEDCDQSRGVVEAETVTIESIVTMVAQPPEPSIPGSTDAADSPAITSTQTPSSAQLDSDGELPSGSDSRKRKVPSNRNKQTRKRLKLKKQQKKKEKLQAENAQKAQEPEDFTPRRIARELDEVVHANANVDLDYD